jgi:hypothetical protein
MFSRFYGFGQIKKLKSAQGIFIPTVYIIKPDISVFCALKEELDIFTCPVLRNINFFLVPCGTLPVPYTRKALYLLFIFIYSFFVFICSTGERY